MDKKFLYGKVNTAQEAKMGSCRLHGSVCVASYGLIGAMEHATQLWSSRGKLGKKYSSHIRSFF